MVTVKEKTTVTQRIHGNCPTLCVPKIRFCNIGDEGRRGQAVMR
jgi:hypothetical protein